MQKAAQLDEYISEYSKSADSPYKFILKFFAKKKGRVILAFFLWTCQRSPCWVIPLATANILDALSSAEGNTAEIIMKNLLLLSFFILQNIFSTYYATKTFNKIVRGIESELRGALVRKMQQLSIMFYKEMQSGKLLSKVTRDVENIETFLDQAVRTIFFIITDVVIALAVTFSRSVVVFLFFWLSVPMAIGIIVLFQNRIARENHTFRREMENTTSQVAEMINLIPVTRAHGLQEVESKKVVKQVEATSDSGFKLDLVNSFFGATHWVAFQFFQALTLGFTAFLAVKGKITVGDVVLFQGYFSTILNQISNLISLYPGFCKGLESARSVSEILSEPRIEENAAIIPLGRLRGEVSFDNVTYSYNSNMEPTLNHFSLKVKAGEAIAFVGGSGAGKSTILNLLIGFDSPQEGRICIDGINMRNLDINEYRSQIAVVPQNTILFAGSIYDNVTYGLDNVSRERVMEVLKQVDLADFVNTLPQGLDTLLAEQGNSLSGGQKQRLAIARAIIRNPKIIVFDEATSALDLASEKKVQEATESLMKTCTTFMVAHRLSTIRNADRIVVIEKGRPVEEGSFNELMEKKGYFYRLKRLQEQ
ncbi:MAG: ABC transporter ATP-binding protein [Lachnospiraceae bacterium]